MKHPDPWCWLQKLKPLVPQNPVISHNRLIKCTILSGIPILAADIKHGRGLLRIHWGFKIFLLSVKHQQCKSAANHLTWPRAVPPLLGLCCRFLQWICATPSKMGFPGLHTWGTPTRSLGASHHFPIIFPSFPWPSWLEVDYEAPSAPLSRTSQCGGFL